MQLRAVVPGCMEGKYPQPAPVSLVVPVFSRSTSFLMFYFHPERFCLCSQEPPYLIASDTLQTDENPELCWG